MNQYAVYQAGPADQAFFNPVYFGRPAVGDVVNDHHVLFVGSLEEARARVEAINSQLPAGPSFGDLLGEQG